VALLAVVGAAWLGPRVARAADDVEGCITHTARPPSEIVVPLTDFGSSPAGVSIVAGETLCLSGTIEEGGFFEPRLADATRGERVLVRVRMETSAKGTLLETRTASPRWMQVSTAAVSGPANLAIPSGMPDVPPGRNDVTHMDSSVRRLLLSGFRFHDPPVMLRYAPERAFELGAEGLATVRRMSALSRTFLGGGFAVELAIPRLRFALSLSTAAGSASITRDGNRVAASDTDARLDAGYEFLRWRGLTGFALGGLAASEFDFDAHANTVQQTSYMVSLQAGFEQLVRLFLCEQQWVVLMISLRGGYLAQLAPGGWMASDGNAWAVAGLPTLDLSGTLLSLNLGIGVDFKRWVQLPSGGAI
jgi:hypothetical protein